MSGRLYRGYLGKWHNFKNSGTNENGRDFLLIHWEIHENKLNEVRLHVESPKAADSIQLNLLKSRIIIAILIKYHEIDSLINMGKVDLGTRLTNTATYKSSEVFRIILDIDKMKSSPEENFALVHDLIGDIIDCAFTKFSKDLKILFN